MKAGALAALALVAGCAVTPPAADLLSGRIAVRVEATPSIPARSVTASFELRGDGERGELRLASPLGATLAEARWAPGEVTLSTGEGATRYATLEDLAREALGEALPLAALSDWLRGRAWAGAPASPIAEGFEQLGWRIDLSRQAEGAIDATRAAPPPAVSLRARLDRPA